MLRHLPASACSLTPLSAENRFLPFGSAAFFAGFLVAFALVSAQVSRREVGQITALACIQLFPNFRLSIRRRLLSGLMLGGLGPPPAERR